MTNIDKYRVAAKIKEYHMISKLIFRRIIILKSMMITQLFHAKMYVKMSKINVFKIDLWTFGHNYIVATLSTFYQTVSAIVISSL